MILKKLDISTKSEGLIDKIGNYFMIEETNSGRIIILDKNKEILTYINNEYKNNEIYTLNWSRYLGEDFSSIVNEIILKRKNCENS